jgi:hypothetical protein
MGTLATNILLPSLPQIAISLNVTGVNRPFNCGLLSTLVLKPFGKTVALGPSERVVADKSIANS